MNAERAREIEEMLRGAFGDAVRSSSHHRGELTVVVDRRKVIDVLRHLRDTPGLAFAFPIDLTAVDYRDHPQREFPERFAVVYHLLSWATEERIRVKAPVPEDDPTAPTAVGLWDLANWTEREVFDMFGIRFEGHPDLRRILMWEEFEDYPLRKDYPLKGKGERERYTVVEDDFPEAARSRRERPSAVDAEFDRRHRGRES